MIHVESIDRFSGVGCTQPLISHVRIDEEVFIAYVKVKNNPEGVRCLINEFISYGLGLALGVLMPECGVALVDDNTIDNTNTFEFAENQGHCFYSKQIEKAFILNERAMPYIDNKGMYERIIVFDHLIYNTDRNPGNLLLSSKKKEKVLYAIDHSHVFKNQSIWDAFCLKRGIEENDYLDENIIDRNDSYSLFAYDKPITFTSLRCVANEFQEIINEELLDSIIGKLPPDWLIDKDDLIMLKQYILYRSLHLNDICQIIVRNRGWKNE